MSEAFTLGVGAAHQLEKTLRKAGWENEDVTRMTQSVELSEQIRAVLRGHAKIEIITHLIDCDAKPYLPEGWSIKPEDQIASGVRGEITFDPAKIASHFVDGQKDGKSIVGHELKKLLEGQPVLPANVLDYLLAHPELIPDAWKGKYLYFWGTIYRDSDGSLCVRCLCWYDGRWDWGCSWLGRRFGGQGPSALLAS